MREQASKRTQTQESMLEQLIQQINYKISCYRSTNFIKVSTGGVMLPAVYSKCLLLVLLSMISKMIQKMINLMEFLVLSF